MDTASVFLGIDAGGTKTHLAMQSSGGPPVYTNVGSANPKNTSFDQAFTSIFGSIVQLLTTHQLQDSRLLRICIGMAGLDTQVDFEVAKQALGKITIPFKFQEIIVVNDAYIGLKSGTDEPFGVCLIAGTGANCFGVSPSGEVWSAGDWGYLLGDQHSGYVLGSKIMQQVMKEYDGRAPLSPLTQYVLNKFSLNSPPELVSFVYGHPDPVTVIASLAQAITDPTLRSHSVIQTGLTDMFMALEQSYQAVTDQLKFSSLSSFPVVLVGGLFEQEVIRDPVKRRIRSISPQADAIFPSAKPVDGALKLAQTAPKDHHLPRLSFVLSAT